MSEVGDEFRTGWRVLAAAAAGNAGGLAALPLYALSSFIAPLQTEFDWSRGAIGGAATIITAGIFLTGPIVGHLCDRHGVRAVALPSIVALTMALATLSLIGGSILTLYAGFALLALCGAGTTSVAWTRVVNTWFERSRGLALGITMTGSGLTAFAVPLILAQVIATAGWRAGFLACAATALLPLPLVWLLLHERKSEKSFTTAAAPGLSRAAAMRTRRFWAMVGAAMIFSAAMGGLIVHVVPLLGDIGMAPRSAAVTASLLGIGIIAGRLGTGALLDRMNGPLLAALLMIITAAGLLVLYTQWVSAAPVAILLIGLALGSEGDLLAFFTARYFGMANYAALFGWIFGFLALGTAIGPLLIAALDTGSGYRAALLVFAFQCLAAAALLGSLGPYPVWPSTTAQQGD